ncbi:unnamed protein product [Fraxinus pennsylvanica]|uniref:DNA-directed RNA polymerase C-terminal domain-containing protein n=1 Tax=Fraxinus pennsylvanica TaxID=56036 RepID=A0AAD2AA99_9LAMI|nr:unnamed protein product [Fraxinus pennsylvanica]
MDEALRFLSEMESAGLIPDHVMYSIFNHGLCKMGEEQKVVQLYKETCLKKITTDYVLHRSILLGLCEKGAVSEARSYFDKVANSDLCFCKGRYLERAFELHNNMLLHNLWPNHITYNILVVMKGLCRQGKLKESIQVLRKMIAMEGCPLGKSRLRWLKIHLANLYGGGVDILSYEGKIAFAENHREDIFDSTDRPLEGKRW